jgi:protein-disulfide isomerase
MRFFSKKALLFTGIFIHSMIYQSPVFSAEVKITPELEAQFKEYILSHPEVIIASLENYQDSAQKDGAKKRDAVIQQSKDVLYKDQFSLVLGNPQGSKNIVVFLDHRCGYCKKNWVVVEELLKKRSDVRLIVKEYPILGEASITLSRLVLATPEDKKAEYFRALMTYQGSVDVDKAIEIAKKIGIDTDLLQKNAQTAQVSSNLDKARSLGDALHLTGTPMYIIQDHVVEGGQTLEGFEKLLDEKPFENKQEKK